MHIDYQAEADQASCKTLQKAARVSTFGIICTYNNFFSFNFLPFFKTKNKKLLASEIVSV